MKFRRLLLAVFPVAEMEQLGHELARSGCDVSLAHCGDDVVHTATGGGCDAAFIDLALEGDGLGVARRAQAALPDATILLVGDPQELDRRSTELLASRYACLQKPLTACQALLALEQAAELRRLREENWMLRRQWEEDEAPDDLVSHSPLMIDLLRQAATVADATEPVTIYGEPGTEKHIVALYIHSCGPKADGPFVRFTCGRHDPSAEEVSLFGTRAGTEESDRRQLCRVDLAVGGTLFLDGVQNLCGACQARLLRLVEETERTAAPAARIICSAPAEAELRPPPSLRKDLMYRLNTFSITIPPLADRREDILPLAERFVRRLAQEASRDVQGISPAACRLLEEYSWPGNVAELRATIGAAVSGAIGRVLVPEDLLRGPSRACGPGDTHVTGPSVEDAERQPILRTLRETDCNKTEAARRLRITRATLTKRIARYRASGLLRGVREVIKC